MDKGRTGSQGPAEEPDENTTRRSRPHRSVRRSDGVPGDRRRPGGSPRPTGRISPSGNNPPGPAPKSRKLPPQSSSDMPGARPPIRRASRPEYNLEDQDGETYPRQPGSPRSGRFTDDPGAPPPPRRNTRPQPPIDDPNEEYYERRPRSRRLPEDVEEEEYYERRPRSRRLPEDAEEEGYYERRPRSRRLPEDVEEEDEEEYYERRPRSQRLAGSSDRNPPLHRYSDEYDYVDGRPRRKRRRVLPMVLTGCGLIIFTLVLAAGVAIFLVLRSALPQNSVGQVVSQQSTQTVNLTSVTRIQVCNKMGSVTITTDTNASAITVTTKKIVPQSNPAEANRIVVEIPTPGSTPTDLVCQQPQASTGTGDSPLIINLNVPSGDKADVTVTLPTKVLPPDVKFIPLNVETLTGDITVTNLNGNPPVDMSLNVKNSGKIVVTNVILGNGSTMHTNDNVTFSGILALPTDPGAQASYHLQSEHGNVDVTLPSTTNIILDACTNNGTITNQFSEKGPQTLSCNGAQGIQGIQGATYYGPLDPSQTPPANMFLVLHTSIGNIVVHKTQV